MINNDDLINQIDDNNKGDKGIRLVRGARIKATLISVSQGIIINDNGNVVHFLNRIKSLF